MSTPTERIRNLPFIKGRPVKKVDLWKIHEIIHTKQAKVKARWKELSKMEVEPTRRATLAGIHDALSDILEQIDKLEDKQKKIYFQISKSDIFTLDKISEFIESEIKRESLDKRQTLLAIISLKGKLKNYIE